MSHVRGDAMTGARVPVLLAVLVLILGGGRSTQAQGLLSPTLVSDLNLEEIHVVGAAGGALYFTDLFDLWRTDGTAAGTTLVRSAILPHKRESLPRVESVASGRLLFFQAPTASSSLNALWRTDGTSIGTFELISHRAVSGELAELNGIVYYFFRASPTVIDIWRTDGTTAGSHRVASINSSNPTLSIEAHRVVVAESQIFFEIRESDDTRRVNTLWRTDGTANGTTPLRRFDEVPGSQMRTAVALGNRLYFSQSTLLLREELWRSDGTPAGTVLVRGLAAGHELSDLVAFGNRVAYVDRRGQLEIWLSDGTAGGTTATGLFVVDLGQSPGSDLVVLGNRLLFEREWPMRGFYASNGTIAGSVLLADLHCVRGPLEDLSVTAGNLHYYQGFTDGGNELCVSDGTPAGTRALPEISPGPSDSAPFAFVDVDGAPFFVAFHPTYVYELWRVGLPQPQPLAASDSFATEVNSSLVVAAPGVLANDSSPQGAPLQAELVSASAHGALTLSPNGGFSYAPSAGFTGTDVFAYRTSSIHGYSNVATVSISVAPVPTTIQPPIGLIAHSIVGNLVTLRWTRPATGPAPTGYVMRGGAVPNQILASIPTGSRVPTFTFAAPTGAFYLRMHSMNGSQTSAASNEILVRVNQTMAPSAPSHLLGMVNGSAVALSWRPTFGGGAPSSYVLDVSGTFNASLPLGLTDSFVFNGVPNGSYTFRVRAVNAFGPSGASNGVPLTFPSPCSGAPQKPADFVAYNVGNTVHLTWNPAAGGPAQTSFVLRVSGAFNLALPLPMRALSAPVPPGSYTFSVSATNACGASPATALQTVVVP